LTPLAVAPLSRAAFAPFGEVIEAAPGDVPLAVNAGTSQCFRDLARLDPGEGGRLIVSIFRAQARSLPFEITLLERHPKASQAFIPLSGQSFLVVVAPPDERIAASKIRAFLAQGRQGVNFAPGVWHHPLFALRDESDFLVIDRDDPTCNCDEQTLDAPLTLHLDTIGMSLPEI
jgi:ureidoglycolate lyase